MMMPFQNKKLSARQRAEDLLSRLELDEKLSQLNMYNPAIPRLGLPAYHWWNEGLHGVARNGKATMFPQAIAVAATFTPDFAFEMGKIISKEARIKHCAAARHGERGIYNGLTMCSPNINIFRDPRWGRGHETYGECPVLTSLMGTAFIRGMQQRENGSLPCAATLKHFAVHSGPEGSRTSFDAAPSPLDLHQTYLYAFKYCLEHTDIRIFMTSYNALEGIPMSVNKKMLQETLRKEWGFQGVVVTDVGTASHLVNEFKYCKDMPEALALEITSGVDVCFELDEELPAHFRTACRRGLLPQKDIDRALLNSLTLKFELGLFDAPEEPDYSLLECRNHRSLSRKIAERSMVLLKNDGILPLKKEAYEKIAVIGPVAADVEFLRGNYAGTATRYVTLLEGLLEAFGEERIIYARGCEISRNKTELCAVAGDRLAEAVTAAECADLVILALGLTPEFEGENGDAGNAEAGGDKSSLEYPQVQQELLEAVCDTRKPVILLNCSGSSLAIPAEKANGVLQIFYPGPEGGRVAADILTGKVNPSGRLPVTFYRSTQALPAFDDYDMRGRTYRYCRENILYPFGYGLSYTTFKYSALTADGGIRVSEDIPCRLRVRNTGTRAGETVIAFFFTPQIPGAILFKQFAGALRLSLESGEEKEVCFTYPAELLRQTDARGHSTPLSGLITLQAETETVTVNVRE